MNSVTKQIRDIFIGAFLLFVLLLMFGCASTQSNAKDMVESLQDSGCTISAVSVRKNGYKILTDCPALD